MTGYKSKCAAAQDKLNNDDLTIAYQLGFYDGKKAAQKALHIALQALEANLGNWSAKTKAIPIIRKSLEQSNCPWIKLTKKEILNIIDQQEAYTQTGLPMFYRDQCLEMARMIETALKDKNT